MENPNEAQQETEYSEAIWRRILFMLLFFLIYSVAEMAIFAVTIVQAGFVVFTKSRNQKLMSFGDSLTKFAYQILKFFVFKTNDKPFPFGDWPISDT